jgi:membrane protein
LDGIKKTKIFAINVFRYVKKLLLKYISDGGPIMASSIAFYFLFSVFPLMLILISLSGILIDRFNFQTTILDFATERIPLIYNFIESNITGILENITEIGVVGFIFFIFGATYVFDSIQFSLNRIYKTKSQRKFWKQKVFGFLIVTLILVISILSFLFSTLLFYLANTVVNYFELNKSLTEPLLKTLFIFLGLLFNFAIFSLIYFFGTNRRIHFKYHIYKGALVAALTWELSKHIFIIYINNFGNFELTYGSIGSIIGFLLWIYISSLILVLGAEINSLDLVQA